MKMVRLVIQVPQSIKDRLDSLKAQGYTAAGFIRSLLEREFNQPRPKGGKKGR